MSYKNREIVFVLLIAILIIGGILPGYFVEGIWITGVQIVFLLAALSIFLVWHFRFQYLGLSSEEIETKKLRYDQWKKKYRVFLAIFYLVFFGMLIGICVTSFMDARERTQMLQQQEQKQEEPDEIDISDWQTYRNDEYGFEVRYPAEAVFEEALGGESFVFKAEYGEIMITPQGRWPGGGLPSEDAHGNPVTINITTEEFVISGIKATRYSGSGISIRDFEVLPNENWTTDGEIRLQPNLNMEGSVGALEQILSTFRFVKNENVQESSSLEQQILRLIENEDASVEHIKTFSLLEFAVDAENQRLFVHHPGGFELERFSGELKIFDGNKRTAYSANVSGFSLLPNKREILVSRAFNVDTWPEDKTQTTGINEEKLTAAADEIGVSIEDARGAIYGAGGKPTLLVNGLFLIDLETYEQTPLGILGGRGGIFAFQDGTILVSNEGSLAYSPNRPYFKFDPVAHKLKIESADHAPKKVELDHPHLVNEVGGFRILAETEEAKLVRMKPEGVPHPPFFVILEAEFRSIGE